MFMVADTFASSPAGYLTGIGTPIIALLIGAMWKAWSGRLAKQDAAMIETNKVLAVLLSEHDLLTSEVNGDTNRIRTLEQSTAVLASQMQMHERYHERKDHKDAV